ncbi:hypothetical protein [Actinoalloteichus hymeniacidonis]|nr:hypothetical protein [Actinoalloteichus hymeniacidonis]MBB5905860.1 hypothetical protein [Actinoalloteichus hymeniacidonis]
MEPFYIAFGTFILILVGVALISRYVSRRRREAFQAWARDSGWTYVPRDDRWLRYFNAPMFRRGIRRGTRHVVTGSLRGRKLVAFEYYYVERQGSGRNKRNVTYRFAVAALFTPKVRPMLEVSREMIGHRIMGVFGMKDLQLESEEFNRAFRIEAENDRFAYDILHPRTMEWMLGDERFKSLPFRLEGPMLLTWTRGRLIPENVPAMATFLVEVIERVPDYVWQD